MAQGGRGAAVAVPLAAHAITEPLRAPWAVPTTFRSPAQVALNVPLTVVAVCSVAFHLKSEHVDAEGLTLAAETQLPINALTPVALGPVVVLVCSKAAQPAAAAPRASAEPIMYFFMNEVSRLERDLVAGAETKPPARRRA